MATGYTHGVQSGEITKFRDFAILCARAMGACVMQRDDPLSKPPEKQVATDYHTKRIAEEKALLASLDALTDAEVSQACRDEYDGQVKRQQERRAERREVRARYESMLSQVRAWNPPTSEHAGMKEFMEKQLTASISFDCVECDWDEPKLQTPAQWKASRAEGLMSSINYHTKQHAEEIERVNERNEWIDQLYASLEPR